MKQRSVVSFYEFTILPTANGADRHLSSHAVLLFVFLSLIVPFVKFSYNIICKHSSVIRSTDEYFKHLLKLFCALGFEEIFFSWIVHISYTKFILI